jgi:hypothetical protein
MAASSSGLIALWPSVVVMLAVEPAGVSAAPRVAAPPVAVTSDARPRLRAARALSRVVVDGKLDDAAWLAATPSTSFTQHFPDEGQPPSEPTSVRVLYDDDALYVGIDCTQLRAPLVRRLMRRDRELPSDGVWIDIDSRRDGVSAFHFGINAAGVLNDGVHFNDVEFSRDWDGNWQGKVAITDHGYSVEIRIPLGDLRFDRLPEQEWGFQVRRFIDARQETDDWSFFSRSAAGVVSNFGRLVGLVGLGPGHRVDLRPFGLARLRHRDADANAVAALAHGSDGHLSVGIDAKAHLSHELTLDLAVLPDFGQVEADTLVLNLSTYETFFPEKRPFFLEGIDTFTTMRTMLYTRRIGRQPAAPALATSPGTPPGRTQTLIDVPDPSEIWGAAKMVGRLGGRTTIGLISAVTGENRVGVEVADPGVARTRELRLADPLTSFNVVRVRQGVGASADAGVLLTATNRFERPGSICPATGLPGGRCFNDAYTGSLDGRWRSPAGDYLVSAQAVGSLLERGGARGDSDGISILPGRVGTGATLWATKQGGAHWLWSLWQNLSDRRLDLNDLGYLERKNDYTASLDLSYRTIEPWRDTVETRTTLQLRYRQTLDGLDLYNAVELNTWWTARSFWSFYGEVHVRGAHFEDRETGDGTALERAGLVGVEGSVSTDPRRRVVGWAFGQAHRIANGYHFEARGQITLRLLPQLDLDLLPALVYQSGEPRYVSVATPDPGGAVTYTFGRQLARNVGATLRASYAFTPDFTVQAYAQLFLLAEHYTDFATFTAAAPGLRARVRLTDLAPAAPPGTNPDVQQTTLNVNVVLRWEYRLGSTLYLVYSRAQTPPLTVPSGDEASLDLRPILRGRAAVDVVLLKVSYWWG